MRWQTRLAAWLLHCCTGAMVGATIQNPKQGFVAGLFAIGSAAIHISHVWHDAQTGSGITPFSVASLRRACPEKQVALKTSTTGQAGIPKA